jgi:hypothetical protein
MFLNSKVIIYQILNKWQSGTSKACCQQLFMWYCHLAHTKHTASSSLQGSDIWCKFSELGKK